jgi:MFS family permease
MVRTTVRLHTGILVVAGLALLVAPGSILAAFGVGDPTFPVLALSRVLAGLIIVLAAAVTPVPELSAPARGYALSVIAAAYGLLSALCFAQQVAIWSSVAGALLSAELMLHAAAFGWLAVIERRSVAVSSPGDR